MLVTNHVLSGAVIGATTRRPAHAFALVDPAPMFEFTLTDLARLVGLKHPLPDS